VLPVWQGNDRKEAGRTKPFEEPEGTAVAILPDGYLVTNFHVIRRAVSVTVRLSDGRSLPAEIIGGDRPTDLAVLKIANDLPVLPLGPEPVLAAPVCAVGNQFGLGLSVTCGVVSATHRTGIGFNPIEDFIQTDAAVNPGMSGGALIDRDGNLVGVLPAIFTKQSDANIGVNFAVSARLTNDVVRLLSETGRVKRPVSGLRLEPAPPKGGTGRLGARIVSLRAGMMGARAGLKAGDIIMRAGGRRVRKPADFVSAMTGLLRSDALEVEIDRGGAIHKFHLKK